MNEAYPIGEMIHFHRKKAGLTQKQLGDLAGTGKTVVYDLEKGKRTVRFDTLEKILFALNIKINFASPLMDEFNTMKNETSQGIRR
jgi:y4mF family transcriptional regulator